ncbi:MAG: potassium channel family protein [Actinomycetes bacterium]
MFTALRSMLRDPQGRLILLWAFGQIILGTIVFRWLEGWSIIDSVYFSVVTLATVGFGDLHPTGDVTKIFTIVYILFGLGVIAAFISEITKHRAAVIAQITTHEHPPNPDVPSH